MLPSDRGARQALAPFLGDSATKKYSEFQKNA
jgi:hypothetical protein